MSGFIGGMPLSATACALRIHRRGAAHARRAERSGEVVATRIATARIAAAAALVASAAGAAAVLTGLGGLIGGGGRHPLAVDVEFLCSTSAL